MKRFTLKGILKTRNEHEGYQVKHLGTVLCSHPGIDEICRAMAEKYTVYSRQKIKTLSLYNLTVSSQGITLEKGADANEESSVKKFSIKRIVYCGVDRQHQKIFAFFYRSPENIYGALECHVVECQSKRHAKKIALNLSETFQEMESEKQEEPSENSLHESNVVPERTISMIQLHMSVESLLEEEREDFCGSPKIQHSRPHERKFNYSDLQLQWTKCENNSSGYGDSSDDLSNEMKMKQRRRSIQVSDGGKSSQAGQVNMDYVNGEIVKSGGSLKRNSASISNSHSQTLGFTKIKDWNSMKKDRNANSFECETFQHKYMNINTTTSEFV